MQKPELVAHRGFAHEYPENSMAAFQAAIDCGCRFLELDIQISKDKKAVVIHDTNLIRTGMRDISVLHSDWLELQNENIGEVSRFADKFENEKIFLLDDFVKLLEKYPEVHAFVEIKEESIDHLGVKTALNIVCESIQSVKSQCSLISFHAEVLFEAKQTTDYPIGFVLHKYDAAHFNIAKNLSPELLICNFTKIPDEDNSLWSGSWNWFLYEIVEPELAMKWAGRGVKYIETMQIAPMIKAIG